MISGHLWYGEMVSGSVPDASEQPENPVTDSQDNLLESIHESHAGLAQTLAIPGSLKHNEGIKPFALKTQTIPVALFDVDQVASIAVPVNHRLEVLPRPPERSMRVCWSVSLEPKANLQCRAAKSDVPERDSKSADSRTAPDDQSTGDNEHKTPESIVYKVAGKVRGCWSSSAQRYAKRCIFI